MTQLLASTLGDAAVVRGDAIYRVGPQLGVPTAQFNPLTDTANISAYSYSRFDAYGKRDYTKEEEAIATVWSEYENVILCDTNVRTPVFTAPNETGVIRLWFHFSFARTDIWINDVQVRTQAEGDFDASKSSSRPYTVGPGELVEMRANSGRFALYNFLPNSYPIP
jgi:hypothetical protein